MKRLRPFAGWRLAALIALLATALVTTAEVRAQAPTAPPAAADEAGTKTETLSDRWYKLELAGAPAGWMRATVTADDETYRTSTETSMRINRGGETLEISITTAFDETRDGRPIRIQSVQTLSKQAIENAWIFEDDHVRSVTQQGGRTVESRLELPDVEWLTPMAVQTLMREKMEAGADAFEYLTVDGQNGVEPTRYTYRRTGEDEFIWDGRAVPVVVWETTVSALGGATGVTKVSHDGHVVHDEVEFPFGRAVYSLTTEADARAAGDEPGPELFVTTFVPVEKHVARADRTVTARMRLRAKAGEMPALPSAGAQRFEAGEDAAEAIIRVDLGDALPATEGERDDAAFRTPSAMVDSADPLVAKLAQRACRDAGDDPMAKADALRTFVARHISDKDLDTAFATASETARMRTGDCSEHGILLCAMLRAEDIPARVATGLVYVDQMFGQDTFFGWHMWTQALIDGRWVDLDATLPTRYNALHVLTATSSMSEASGVSDLATVMQLMGNLEIEIEDVGYDDATGAPDAP